VFVKTIFNEESQMLIKWEKGRCYYFFVWLLFIYLFSNNNITTASSAIN